MSAGFVMNAMFYLSLAGALLVAWQLTRPMPGPLEWAIATICFAIAFTQISAGMQTLAPPARLVNGLLWLSGGALLFTGVRRFFGRPTLWRATFGFVAAVLAGVAWVVLSGGAPATRIAITSFGGLVLLGGILFTLITRRDRGAGMGLVFALLGFGLLFTVLLVRLHHMVFRGEGDFNNLGYLVAFAAMPTAMAVGLLGLLLMTLERLLQQLHEAKARVEEASRAKTDFLIGMGHELRTPLNAIMGFNQMLACDPAHPLSPVQLDYVREIEQGGLRLLRLIEDARDVERIEHRGFTVRPEKLEVAPMLRDAAAVVLPASRNAGLTLTVSACVGTVLADRGRLQQVLGNLLSNAVKYNRPGGEIHMRAWRLHQDWTRIEVLDTGIGIPIGRQAEMFQRFNRLGAEASGIEGTGIGLAIARELAEAMGGRMGFESAEGSGSRFWLDLPAAQG